jgi:hypothetical protein
MKIKKTLGINTENVLSIDYTQDNHVYTPNVGGMKNTLMPRLCQDPTTDYFYQIQRIGVSHVSYPAYVYGRRSTDGGVTWTGMDGTGTETLIVSEANYDLRNIGAFFTRTGRFVIIYMRYYQANTWHDTKYIYSDNAGSSWSSAVVFPKPPTWSEATKSPNCYTNKCVYDASGNILLPIHYTPTTGGIVFLLAKSTNNGETWDTEYKTIVDNSAVSPLVLSEMVVDDFGDGVFVGVSRLVGVNAGGENSIAIFSSQDYGEHWAGASETLDTDDIENSLYNSGWLWFEGDEITLGSATNSNDCLPDICFVSLRDTKWIVVLYWIRYDGGSQETVLKISLINLWDYLENGASAIIYNIEEIVFNGVSPGSANRNGGNGSSVVVGNDILHATYEQKTSSDSGDNDNLTIPIRSAIFNKAIDNYYAAKLNPSLKTDHSATGNKVVVMVDVNATGFGAALYLATDGHYEEADADADTTMPCIAIALEAGTGRREVLLEGYIRDNTWNWTVGAVIGLIYVDIITGGLTQTAPSGTGDQVQIVGYAVTADIMYFKPNLAIVEIA